ncbi:hypothetical protein [Streptomyces bobili]|uniref:hypothetical protein n=1 Tax=Streptomyces bobili TaxID=67280 RepID=UPI00379EF3D9
MDVEYLHHGVPLADYQLTKADRRRQDEAAQVHEWVQRQLAKAPPWSEERWERMRQLLGPPVPPWELQRWQLRLYCGHVVEATRSRERPRPDGGVCDEERCPECGMDPAVIVAFEPPANNHSPKSSRFARRPPSDRRSKAELVAENNALRAELKSLRGQA